jgi:murein DD-endopeptidase MepM/ murein hydrolase activator NlpD
MRLSVLSVVFAVAAMCGPNHIVSAGECWRPPVAAPVTDPFRHPACRWCAGNRGIEYGTEPGVEVRAVAAGRVTFAGRVAGTGYLVIRHRDGRRATYGGLSAWRFGRGDLVLSGMIVGTSAGPLHFGLRDHDRYIDPSPWIGRIVRRPWLVPVTGDRPVRAPRPVLRCRR